MKNMVRWYVVSITPSLEGDVLEALDLLDVPTFSPKMIHWRKLRPYERKVHGRTRVREETALFPGYLFVQMDTSVVPVSRVRDVRGVHDFLRWGGFPCPVRDSVVELLRTLDYDFAPDELRSLRSMVGSDVTVPSGLMAGVLVRLVAVAERKATIRSLVSGIAVTLPVDDLRELV